MSGFNPEGIVWASLKPLRGNLFAQNLTKKTYRIGRDENKNEVCLSDLAIQLEHCEISQKQDGTCWLKNLSDNEICVDEKILQKDEETELGSGDTIKLAGDSNGQDNILSYVFSKPKPPYPLKRPSDIELEIPFEKSVKPPPEDLATEDWNYESLKSTFESFWSEMPEDMGFDEEDNSERFSKEYQSKWTQFKTIPTMIEPISLMASKFDILSSVVAKVYQLIVSPINKEQNLSKLRTLKHIVWQNFFGLLDQIEGRCDNLSLYIRGELLRSEFIGYSPDKFDIYEDLYHQFIKNFQEIKALKDFENTSKITKGAYKLINDIFNHPETGLSLVNAFRKLKLSGPNPLCEMEDSQAIFEIKKLLPTQIIQYIENNYLLTQTFFGVVGISKIVFDDNTSIGFDPKGQKAQIARLVMILLHQMAHAYYMRYLLDGRDDFCDFDPNRFGYKSGFCLEEALLGENTRIVVVRMPPEASQRILDVEYWKQSGFLKDLVKNYPSIEATKKKGDLYYLECFNIDPFEPPQLAGEGREVGEVFKSLILKS